MNVLLTGATGFLGYRTLEMLVQDPLVDQVIATGRTLKPTHQVDHPKVKYVLGDLSSKDFVQGLIPGISHIIHTAALSSPWGTFEAFQQANVLPQQHLVQAAENNGIKRFVFVSTPSVYFDFKDKKGIRESDPLPKKLINHYAVTKREAEKILEASGLHYVILRPRALTGRGDTVIMPRLIRAYDEGKLKIIGDGENVVDLSSVANVVQAILLGLHAEAPALNQIYNISNGRPVRLWDAVADVLSKLDRTPPTKKIPFGLVKAIAGLMETKSRWSNGKEPALTRYGVGTLAKTFTMDINKAREMLHYEPKVTTEEAIDEFVNWYKANAEG